MKRIFQNLTFAILVPTILFGIALLSIHYMDLNRRGRLNSELGTVLHNTLEANSILCPHLKFYSTQEACLPNIAAFHKKYGRNYYVSLKDVFPHSKLDNLRAYTVQSRGFQEGDAFFCEGGFIGDNFLLARRPETGEYYLIGKQGIILLGKSKFEQPNSFWQDLADSKNLATATIVLLLTLSLLIVACAITPLKNQWGDIPAGISFCLLPTLWFWGYSDSLGDFRYYDFPNVVKFFIFLCWTASFLSLCFALSSRHPDRGDVSRRLSKK